MGCLKLKYNHITDLSVSYRSEKLTSEKSENKAFRYLPFGEAFAEQHAGSTYETPYKFNAKELDIETGLYYYGSRYYDPSLSMFMSTDRFSDKFSHQSPYTYAANNPIRFIDMNGDSADIYTMDGQFHGTIDDGRDDITGMLYNTVDDYENGTGGTSFGYNDIETDRQRAQEGYFTSIVVADDNYVDGFIDSGIKGMKKGSLLNLIKESDHGGSLDYNSGPNGVPGRTLTITNSKQGGSVGYNVEDFGNYLTGQAYNRLGFGSGLPSLAGHAYSIYGSIQGIYDSFQWRDSAADQSALRNGWGHYQKIKPFSPQFPRGPKF